MSSTTVTPRRLPCQLGIVAQAQRQWDAAADYLRQALQIAIEFNDR
ncbi:MAG: hypothetical protein IPL78_10525 [Chloroflexi bacterium]|nr:hypothetical protein [Chloroflexota bacterium]